MNGFDALKFFSAAQVDRETSDRTAETERWAAFFAQALPADLRHQLGIAAEESSDSWQGGVGTLTQPEPLAPALGPAEETGVPAESLVFTVKAGDLGELRCQLERTDAGVRVLIGVDGRNALTAAGAEQSALESALRAAGLTVKSLTFVSLSKFGTTLARGGGAQDGRPVRQAPTGARERGSRRVKLIG